MKHFKQLLAMGIIATVLALTACSSLGLSLFQKPEVYNTLEVPNYQMNVTFKFLLPEALPIPDRTNYRFQAVLLTEDQELWFLTYMAVDQSHAIGIVVDTSKDPEEAGVGLAYYVTKEKLEQFWIYYEGQVPVPVSKEVFMQTVDARIAEHNSGGV